MDLAESLKMAVKTLVTNRTRSALTMLGIVIGNASVIAMIGVGEGAQRFIKDQFEALGPNVLFVLPGSPDAVNRPVIPPKTLVLADAEAIASQVPSVQAVAPEITSSELVKYRNKNSSSLVIGTTPPFTAVRNFEVERGRFLTELDIRRTDEVVVLGSALAQKLFEGQNPIGKTVRIRNVRLTVIGVMEPKGSSLGTDFDDTAILPITTMADRVVGRTSPYGLEVTWIFASARDENSMEAAQFQIENLLRQRHQITDEDDFTVRNQKDLLETFGAITGALTLMLAAIAGISLLVGGIGIMNIMLVSVTERTQEIGLRKAIGASQQDILLQFIIEAVILSAAGGLIGTGLGIGGIVLVSNFTPLKASVSLSAIVIAVTVSGGIGLFFGVVPARQAARLDPIVALRSS
ncbi:ABC transporter permease [Geitlerinema sp. PCC 7407]|uniref:ABC transporter permease n=1 Tax=Geitlerinema sp. PCC 7407 TaxID=1173025 RepID=UPI00029FA277|nr:ABC transporter permease [Geitlerinema sp. PCC 7407]AFY65855.1 protein of unknown function DUF214 [Geitlerinema sp. PCC 7407]